MAKQITVCRRSGIDNETLEEGNNGGFAIEEFVDDGVFVTDAVIEELRRLLRHTVLVVPSHMSRGLYQLLTVSTEE